MKNRIRKSFMSASWSFVAFVLWTVAVSRVDLRAIGPQNSSVGFATVNGFFHSLTGVHFLLYNITDWLGLVPIFVMVGFAVLGLAQWIKRRQLRNVDVSLFVLGGFYIVVAAAYLFFENVVINYRPVLIEGILEASYPSSTTLLVMCVMPTALMQLKSRVTSGRLRCLLSALIIAFTIFMVVIRLISGVHWLSDIVGGILLSAGLVSAYHTAVLLTQK